MTGDVSSAPLSFEASEAHVRLMKKRELHTHPSSLFLYFNDLIHSSFCIYFLIIIIILILFFFSYFLSLV